MIHGPSIRAGHAAHYGGDPDFYYRVGEALGRAMVGLLEKKEGQAQARRRGRPGKDAK